MKQYTNYIFDFYGTLCDIQTDEDDMQLWNVLTRIFAYNGIYYQPEECHQKYIQTVKRHEQNMINTTNNQNIEIDLFHVFDDLTKHQLDRSSVLQIMIVFRTLSRKRFKLYKNTEYTLKTLKQNGKRIFLLSNAQAVFTRPELEMTQVTKYMDDIYISSECGVKKPSHLLLDKICHEHDLCLKDTVMVGNDFISDIQMANSYDIDAIHINTDHYSYKAIVSQIHKCNPNHKVYSIQDIKEIIKEDSNGHMVK